MSFNSNLSTTGIGHNYFPSPLLPDDAKSSSSVTPQAGTVASETVHSLSSDALKEHLEFTEGEDTSEDHLEQSASQSLKKHKSPQFWTFEEDNLLRELWSECKGEMQKVAKMMKNRTVKQCTERWNLHVQPGIDHSPITPDEDHFILQQYNLLGKKWKKIAEELTTHRQLKGIPGIRTSLFCKNFFYSAYPRKKLSLDSSHNISIQSSSSSSSSAIAAFTSLPKQTLNLPSEKSSGAAQNNFAVQKNNKQKEIFLSEPSWNITEICKLIRFMERMTQIKNIDWETVSKHMARSINSCQNMWNFLNTSTEKMQSAGIEKEKILSSSTVTAPSTQEAHKNEGSKKRERDKDFLIPEPKPAKVAVVAKNSPQSSFASGFPAILASSASTTLFTGHEKISENSSHQISSHLSSLSFEETSKDQSSKKKEGEKDPLIPEPEPAKVPAFDKK